MTTGTGRNKRNKSPIAKRVENLAFSATRQMSMLAREVPDAISLGQGIPHMKTPAYIREGVARYLNENSDIGKYSIQPGILPLREAIAKRMSTKEFRVDPEKNICVTAGGIAALASVITALVEKDDEVIVLDPSYPSHSELIPFSGGKPVFVPLDSAHGWTLNRKKMRDAISKKTKAILLSSPSNPTGTVLNKSDLDFIVELVQKHNLYIIGDQTYEFLVFDKHALPTLRDYPEIQDRLILCYSFSKEFAMTGWRVGYLYAPREILEPAMKVHDALIICTPTVSQYAALIALTEKPKRGDADISDELAKNRTLMCKRLDTLSDYFSYAKPQGAYYIFAKYKNQRLSSWDFTMKMLQEARVVVIPGSSFGPSGEGHVRFSYGASAPDINEAFDRIERWCKTLR